MGLLSGLALGITWNRSPVGLPWRGWVGVGVGVGVGWGGGVDSSQK